MCFSLCKAFYNPITWMKLSLSTREQWYCQGWMNYWECSLSALFTKWIVMNTPFCSKNTKEKFWCPLVHLSCLSQNLAKLKLWKIIKDLLITVFSDHPAIDCGYNYSGDQYLYIYTTGLTRITAIWCFTINAFIVTLQFLDESNLINYHF